MRYGLPYKGSKSKLAEWIEDIFIAMVCDYASFGNIEPFPSFERLENYAKEIFDENSIS